MNKGNISTVTSIGTEQYPHCLIIDKTIDGIEYQMVRRSHFFEAVSSLGIELKLKYKESLKSFISPILLDFLSVKDIIQIFEKLGISEILPKTTKFLNFEVLDGESIRIVNRIIKLLDDQNIKNVQSWLPKEHIESFSIVSKDKEHFVETMKVSHLTTFLADLKITNYGEELNERFIELIELSHHHDDYIMIKKLQKAVEIVSHPYNTI